MSDESCDNNQAFCDALFRVRRKSGTYKVVAAPKLEVPVVDTHAHVHYLKHPSLAFARAAAYGMPLLGLIIDEVEDGNTPFAALDGWLREAEELLPQLLANTAAATDPMGTAAAAAAAPVSALACGGEGGEAAAYGAVSPVPSLPNVRLCVGVHPHNAKDWTPDVERALRRHLTCARVAAIGEIGLDYHYDLSPRAAQKSVFARQIQLAHETGLPVALHVREAHDDAFSILEEQGWPKAGVLLHCFTSDWETLAPWVDAGCYVAFGGALTFNSGEAIRDAAARVPADRLLTETDSPYMTPVPLRGVECEPAHVLFTAARLAEVRGCAPGTERQALLEQLELNARAFLDRPRTPWQETHAHDYVCARETLIKAVLPCAGEADT
ncbi:TatD family hydrolase [Adlercreutzia sp. ZJ138]|uniref:TatD family hydrolase n=1 Tax=Adlercreutzia sp. ZJ138 TaxID=2709405 RepID=UPI001F14F248|nr:TatD family hydrolase [Adlercreutzia sp. ZJ138]